MKKRRPELITGLIGSIIGTVMGGAIFVIYGFIMAIHNAITWSLIIPFLIFILQIVAIVLSCSVNKMNHKLYGGLMIAIGVITIVGSVLFLYIPAILYIVSGGMAFRKLRDPSQTT
ncbi:hypothetical protein CON65_11215 [Bacillus pseudomycoides]|uniref:DUF4064 domain-containing protein n=1 Tax=Bacillus pseudomycoides TaxID=64104 RepID=A0AA91ZTE6_9BACI|nr:MULTISPECIES: hypothetical protein [Bacillus]PEB47558.1 hypothetical protein COO03_25885 [Bacillus sp. AFS098217]PED82524.1 hypothetical protein CON65_11215 [Bacillus pseudomycoides]PEU11525.1 hypothetical protein CN525_21975 [Bacillus sp. AFS014408]PEU17282.1 hypothetical protein CN524_02770 [Bacillus sp. AFS019443]PFW60721.1 hypothetical protein COL20_20735 [Bacillus sp. AFS075034]